MKLNFRQSVLALLSGGAVLLAGCGDKEEGAAKAPAPTSDQQGLDGFFAPAKGELWAYRVQRSIPLDAKLTPADEARKPERTDSGYLVTFERERRCVGTTVPEGAEGPLTGMEIYEDGVRRGQELYDIGPAGVFSRGWLSAEEGGKSDVLEKGVAVALPKMKPGNIWEGTGEDPDRRFLFRIIERVEVEVPAGSFDASRIQITSSHEGRSLKRTIWFAENVGIVKEESVYYGPQRTRIRERAELIRWNPPRSGDDPAGDPLPEPTVPVSHQPEGGEPSPVEDDPSEDPPAPEEDEAAAAERDETSEAEDPDETTEAAELDETTDSEDDPPQD